jgi:Spy/CpxP family protein refolding chaperone
MKQLSRLFAIALLVVPTALAAQPGPRQGMGPGGPEGADPAGRIERLVTFLDLSDAQKVQIEEITVAQGESRQALSETMRSRSRALQEMLESEQPDATAIGNNMIEVHALRKQMAANQEAHLDALRGLLTPEQVEKFDALMAAREFSRDREGGRQGRGRPRRDDQPRQPRG